jgi:hypothetical protein
MEEIQETRAERKKISKIVTTNAEKIREQEQKKRKRKAELYQTDCKAFQAKLKNYVNKENEALLKTGIQK